MAACCAAFTCAVVLCQFGQSTSVALLVQSQHATCRETAECRFKGLLATTHAPHEADPSTYGEVTSFGCRPGPDLLALSPCAARAAAFATASCHDPGVPLCEHGRVLI